MSTTPPSEFNDSRYAETMAGPRAEYSKEQQDIAIAAVALQTGVLSERQLATAMVTWTIHGSVPLADHLRTLALIDEPQQQHLAQRAAQRLAAAQRDSAEENGSGTKSALLGTLDAIDPAGAIARLMGIRAAAGAGASDATGLRSAGARYRLLRKLGQGGLGRVWLAFDELLKRHVAVKEIVRSSDNAGALERFRREAEITGRLEHPGIVPIYQLGDDDQTGEAFYAMRFLGKTTLQDAIAEYHERRNDGDDNPMLIRRLLTDFVAVCQAIGHAHSRKVIHRDLKPENIAIDSFGQVIVIDWGIAKVIDEFHAGDSPAAAGAIVGNRSTMDGQVLGTPLYMAPEQAAGRVDDLDERTDIYGLGAILYAILTGYAPHERTRAAAGAATGRDLIAAISNRPTPSAVEVNPTVDRALAAICAKAMARRQYARYPSASELAEDVQRWMAGEPVSAYRERPLQRVARWISKNRIWSQLIAALLIIGLVSLVTLGIATRHSQLAAWQARFDDMRGLEREIEVQLTGTAEELAKNTLFMAMEPSIQSVVNVRRAPTVAAPPGEDEEVLRGRLEQNFEGLLRANDDYLSVSYVALVPEEGSEVLVRVERNAGNAAFVRRVPQTRLGSFADKQLFAKTLELPPGETLVTLAQPKIKPAAQSNAPLSVRGDARLISATPVYDDTTGAIFGMVAVELDLLARMVEVVEPLEQRTAGITLTDASGQVLLRDTVAEGLTIERRDVNIAASIPELTTFFQDDEARETFDRAGGWFARRVQLDQANPAAQLGIVLQLQD
jgi:serine/threonine protein kinase